jgi:acylphosphatase
MTSASFHAIIEGEVQGVGYRFFVHRHAKRLAVKGFVRNLPDGTVEVLAEGEREALNELLELLKEGPPAAFVRDVKVEWLPPKNEFRDFIISF